MTCHRQTNSYFTLGLVLLVLLGLSHPVFAENRGGLHGRTGGGNPGTQTWQNPGGRHDTGGNWSRQGNIRGTNPGTRNRQENTRWTSPPPRTGRSQISVRSSQDTVRNRPGNRGLQADRHVTRSYNWNRSEDRYLGYRRGWDTRYHHNRYYPARGHYVRSLPRGYHTVYHHRAPYYFWEGVWYRPFGAYFTIVSPPIGLVIPFLPPFYTTLWVGGVPYYYANETYYTYYSGGGYIVTDPPKNEISEDSPEADWLYSYPARGQSEKQQDDDRYACHRWAVDQTGYDPTLPLGGVPESQAAQKRSDYQRALGACLEGRGYSVK